MRDESDPFDLANITSSRAVDAEAALRADMEARKRGGNKPEWLAGKIVASRTGAGKPGTSRAARSQKRFTKFPGSWEEVLGKARASGATYAVAIVLQHEAWRLVSNGSRPVVKLTDTMLKRVCVGRRGKRAALRKLEQLKLVGVERRGNGNPLVTVYVDG